MSSLSALATAVAAELSEYEAVVNYAPDFKLSNLAVRKVVVVPMAKEHTIATRGGADTVHRIEVGLLFRAKEPDVPALMAVVEFIGTSFLGKKLLSQTCTNVSWEPIYSADDLRANNQFTSVISLSFKGHV